MEPVFRALAAAPRRDLLDRLFEADGLTLAVLGERLDMTRFGVMKHLRVLEDANLVVAQRVGREKRHYLNPVPIREIHDRWVSKFAAPWARSLVDLKSQLEGDPMSNATTDDRRHVFAVYIRTTPEALWEAITSGDHSVRYFHGSRVQSAWTPGAPVTYFRANGDVDVDGEVLEADPPRCLTFTWHVAYDAAMATEPPSRVTWEIEPQGDVCKLTLTHDRFPAGSQVFEHVAPDGWGYVLSGLKTLLETSAPLRVPA